jgi:hypothetical protein
MILQNLGNCEGAVTGTGLGNCSNLEIGDFKGIGLLNKGTKFTSLTQTSFETLITTGKLHQLLGVEDFEVANAENETFTSSQGFAKTIRNSKPTETLTFRKGMCFDKALTSLVSNNKYDVIKYFDKGVLLATTKDGVNMKGFSVGMIDKAKYTQLSGGDPANSKIMFQCVDSSELDLYWVFIPYSSLNFDPLTYQGVIQTTINVVSNTAGVLTLEVLDNCNSSVDYSSVVPAVAGSFTLTGATIDDVTLTTGNLVIEYTGTATAVALNIVEDVDGNFYKSAPKTLS